MIAAPPSSSSPRWAYPPPTPLGQQGGVCCRHGAPSYSSSEVVATLVSPSSGGSSHCQEGANCSTPFGACLCGMIPCYPVLSHDEAQLIIARRHHHLQLQQQARMMEAQLVMAHHHHQLQLQQQARMLAYHQSRVIHQDDPNASLIDNGRVPIMAMYKSKKKAEQRAKKAEICKRKPKLVHKVTPPHSTKTAVQTAAVGEGGGGSNLQTPLIQPNWRGKSKVTSSDPSDKQHIADAIAAVNDVYGDGTEKQRKLNEVTLRGVTQRPSRKWQAQLHYAGKSRYIGVFESKEKASLAYEIAREILKGNKHPAPSEIEKNVNLARKASCLGVGIEEPP